MANYRLALPYAQSLIDFAQENGKLEEVKTDMFMINDLIDNQADFRSFVKSPIITTDNKEAIFEKMFKGKVNDITFNFLKLLISKKREAYIYEMCNAFIDRYNAINEIHKMQLTTATKLSETAKANILNKIKTALPADSKLDVEEIVDEKLIGGFVLKYDNKMLDTSIKRKLNLIREELHDDSYEYKIYG